MMRIRLGVLHRNQRGLTLVELLIAIVLASIVTAGITVTIGHMFAWTTRTNNHMIAVRQVQSAGYWVSRDALQAKEVAPDPDSDSGFPLRLMWEWEEITNEVIYDLQDGDLIRTSNGSPTIIARFVEEVRVEPLAGHKHRFTVTASVGGQSETRVYEVTPRPDA